MKKQEVKVTLKKHNKHTHLQKPNGGKFHLNEFGFIGAPCGLIQNLSKAIAKENQEFKLAYVDADHGESETQNVFFNNYTDKISSHNLLFNSDNIEYEFRNHFLSADAVLINANHFNAEKQIVLINNKKKESLSRKLERLNNVICFVLDEGMNDLHDYLKSHLPNYKTIPIFKISQVKEISEFIKNSILKNIPKIKGLLLAGGKSQRMGRDKTLIEYHGRSQKDYMMDLLSGHCESNYISLAEKSEEIYPVIEDQFKGLGPYGGILSAFRNDPNSAWLTIAADIPLLNDETLKQLVEGRNTSAYATCFHNPETNFPEPLITIWEPRIYPRLLNFLSLGYSCPRKALINSEIEELQISNSDYLLNANTPEEVEMIKSKINS